jgi:signal transduction histidine kinase
MKVRIASVAVLLGSLSTGLAWLTFAPMLGKLVELVRRDLGQGVARELLGTLPRLLPVYLFLDLLLMTFVCYAILQWVVGRPLAQTEASIEQLGRLQLELPLDVQGGPLLSRIQSALGRMAEALRREQALTQRQLHELKAANERLSQTQTELVAAERLATVGKLASGIAHEVGNPLGGILGYLSLVRDRTKAGAPQALEFLDRIEGEVQRINGIVRSLLDLGRPPRGTTVPVDVPEVARTSAGLLSANAELANVSVELDVPPSLIARAEPGPLAQILLNLLLNAAQAMQGKGKVTLRVAPENGHVRVDVDDTGPGLPPEVLPRVFEPFFTTKPAGQGTGLGLAVCLHLATAMNAQLRAENLPAGGARFTLLLPGA